MIALMLAEFSTAYTIISLIISLTTAAILLSQSPPDPIADDDRTAINYATRGAYIPLVVGQDLISPIVMWVQPDPPSTSGDDGAPAQGKGTGGSPQISSIKESALHAVCVGPLESFDSIRQNGRVIWRGPITPASHPSGSLIDIGEEGKFVIYWGFRDDTRVDLIHDASNHGLTTRYPLITKVLWAPKELGPSRNWPRLQYEVTAGCRSKLGGTPARTPEVFDQAQPIWQDLLDLGLTITGPIGSLPIAGQTTQNTAGDYIDRPKLDILGFEPASAPPNDRTRFVFAGDDSFAVIGTGASSGQLPPALGALQPDYSPFIRPGHIVKIFGNQAALDGRTIAVALFSGEPTPNLAGEFLYVYNADYSNEYYYKGAAAPPGSGWIGVNQLGAPWGPGNWPAGDYIYGMNRIFLGPRVRGKEIRNIDFDSQLAGQTPKISPVKTVEAAALNPAHIIDQLMFQTYPYGAGLNRNRFDITSLEESAWFIQTNETFRGSISLKNGEEFSAAVSKILIDVGMMVAWDPTRGVYVFRLIRHPGYFGQAGTDLPEMINEMSMIAPQTDNSRGLQPIDKMLFTVVDRNRNYRENPISIDDHGQAEQQEVQHAKKIPIYSTHDYETGKQIARRRAQEASANQNVVQFELTHQARLMFPSLAFTAKDILGDEVPFRTLTVERDPQTNRVKVSSILDSYDPPLPEGLASSSTLFSELNDSPETFPTEKLERTFAAVAADSYELPRYLSSDGKIRLFFPSIRSSSRVAASRIWISLDGTTFVVGGTNTFITSGGTLKNDLAAETNRFEESGIPIYVSDAGDMQRVENLTASEESFRLGRQVALIGSEICFLRNANPTIDAGEWELDGLLRGRLGTVPQKHEAGTPVYIFFSHEARFTESILFLEGKSLYSKQQPVGIDIATPLTDLPQKEITIQGLAYKPMDPGSIWISGQRQKHNINETLLINWTYRSPHLRGAGMQGYGDPYVKPLYLDLSFRITISDPLGVNDDIEAVAYTNGYTFTGAARSAAGYDDNSGDEWDITVRMIENGYESAPITRRFSA